MPYWDYDVPVDVAVGGTVDGVIDASVEGTENGGTQTEAKAGAVSGRLLKRVSKTSKSSTTSSSTATTSNNEEDSDRAQSDPPVKSDRAQSNRDSDHPRDTSAAAIMCSALLELGKILESMSTKQQQQQQERRRRRLEQKSTSKPPAADSSSTPPVLGSSQQYIFYALTQLHSLSSPAYRTLPSSSRQLMRVSKTHPLINTPSPSLSGDTLTVLDQANVTIQDKDGCYFLCEEVFLLKHGTGHFPHHRRVIA